MDKSQNESESRRVDDSRRQSRKIKEIVKLWNDRDVRHFNRADALRRIGQAELLRWQGSDGVVERSSER